MPRFRAPTADREVLAVPDFAAVPRLVEENRRKLDRADVVIGGLPLRELRAMARREALELANGPASAGRVSPDAPLLLAGHQPELSHPGVWAKHFALNGLARKVGGIPLNLVVDNDTLKSTSLRVPTFGDGDPSSFRLEAIAFDRFEGEVSYEDRFILDEELFRSFPDRAAEWATDLDFEPLIYRGWVESPDPTIAGYITAMRKDRERAWGCDNRELSVSRLSQTEAFGEFAGHILNDLSRFRDVYNAAIRAYRTANRVRSANHPAPELADGEAPFWVRNPDGRRQRATATSNPTQLRPRALTLTLFARVCLGDFFIHGIGGGKYDEVTDAIIRDYFGIDPPAYQVLSATLHMPLPAFPTTAEDLREAERESRDRLWNPQRHLRPTQSPLIRGWVEEKMRLAAAEPPRGDHAARRERYHRLRHLTGELRIVARQHGTGPNPVIVTARAEVAANAILRRRDYSWVLYPEDTLRPFLQQFLTV